MKILAIRGKNLASLAGDFEVDFTVEPLKNAGIFAITGSTGSGKSTLMKTLLHLQPPISGSIEHPNNTVHLDLLNLHICLYTY